MNRNAFVSMLKRHGAVEITVHRRTRNTWNKGLEVEGSISVIEMDALVIDDEGAELDRLPEGMRTNRVKQIFATRELWTATDTHEPDLVVIGDEQYEVFRVVDYSSTAGIWIAYAARTGDRT